MKKIIFLTLFVCLINLSLLQVLGIPTPSSLSFVGVAFFVGANGLLAFLFIKHTIPLETPQKNIASIREEYQKTRNQLLQQTEYMSFAAHELKQPISLLMLQFETQLLSNKNNAEIEQNLKVIESALDQLKKLMTSLFDTQKFEIGKMTLQPQETNFYEFLKKLNEQFTSLMKNHNIHYQFKNISKRNTFINMDANRITQVLYNLINNAIRFTKPFGTIQLIAEVRGRHLHVSVSDNGEGVEPETQRKLFSKFQQGEKQNGMGLGLYVCRNIIHLHGGEVSYKENSPKGSTFTISLPVQQKSYSRIYP